MGQQLGRLWEQIQGSGQLIGRLWEWLQGSAFASRRTVMSNEDIVLGKLTGLMSRQHVLVQKEFNEKYRKSFLRWRKCPETVFQALQEIYDGQTYHFTAHNHNQYEEHLLKAKATVEIIEGFPDMELPYKQEMLTYIYCCTGMTYINIGDFTKAKGFDHKDWEMAVERLLGKLPVDEHPWEVALLHLVIIRCHLLEEDSTIFGECSKRSLDAAKMSEDQTLLLYGTVLLALAEAKRHSNLEAFNYVTSSLEISESLNDEVATKSLNDVYQDLSKKVLCWPLIGAVWPESATYNPKEGNIVRGLSSVSDENDYPDQVTEDMTEPVVAQQLDLRFQSALRSTQGIPESSVYQGSSIYIWPESATYNPKEDNIVQGLSRFSDENDYPDQVTEDMTEPVVAHQLDLRFQSALRSTQGIPESSVYQDEPHGYPEQETNRKEVYTEYLDSVEQCLTRSLGEDHIINGEDTELKEFSGSMNPTEETQPKEFSGCYTQGRLGPEGKSNPSSFNPAAPSYSRTSTDSDAHEDETVPKEI